MTYLIDLGSSTMKVYAHQKGKLSLKEAKTFNFKDGFDNHIGLTEHKYTQLLTYISELQLRGIDLSKKTTKIFATGIFREISDRSAFVERFYADTGMYINIISHELEQFYLESAWTAFCDNSSSFILINIGGRTTEIVIYSEGRVHERQLIDIGVGTILEDFPDINNEYSLTPLAEVVSNISARVPKIDIPIEYAIYTGGELNYMKIADYGISRNLMFDDCDHPVMISLSQYANDNRRIFEEVSIEKLHEMMPDNPKWMDGARACSALAQAICENYDVGVIVPSDSNLIDGVIRQEARSVVLCGSFNRSLSEISLLAENLQLSGISVLSPLNTQVIGNMNGFVLFEGDEIENQCTWTVETRHLKAIEQADLVVVCNFDDYVGTKTALEIGYAYKCGKRILFLNDGNSVVDFDIPSEIGLIQKLA